MVTWHPFCCPARLLKHSNQKDHRWWLTCFFIWKTACAIYFFFGAFMIVQRISMTIGCEEFVGSKEQIVTKSSEMILLFLSSEYLRIEFAHLRINTQGRRMVSVLFEGHFNYWATCQSTWGHSNVLILTLRLYISEKPKLHSSMSLNSPRLDKNVCGLCRSVKAIFWPWAFWMHQLISWELLQFN